MLFIREYLGPHNENYFKMLLSDMEISICYLENLEIVKGICLIFTNA